MIIRAVDLENIRSHKSSHIDFKNGITVIMGDVGSGKTTILEAIKFALFGGSSEQYRNLLRFNENQGSVSVLLENETDRIRITRILKRTRDGFSGSTVFLSINGREEEKSDREMKKFISQMFSVFQYRKRDPLFFRTVIYASQEEMRSIISMDPNDRREMILDLFQITSYKSIIENCEIVKQEVKNRIEHLKGELGDGLKIAEAKERIGEIEDKIRSTVQENENLMGKMKNEEENLKSLRKKLMEMDAIKDRIKDLEHSVSLQKELKNNMIDELNRKNSELKEIENSRNRMEKLREKENRYLELKKEFSKMQKAYDEYNKLKNNLGPLENELRNLLKKKGDFESRRKSLESIDLKIENLKNNIENVDEKELDEMKENLSYFKKQKLDDEKTIDELMNEIEDLRNLEKLSVCPKCKRPLEPEHTEILIREDNEKIEEKKRELEEIKIKINELGMKIEEYRYKINKRKEIEKSLNELNGERSSLLNFLSGEEENEKKIEITEKRINELKMELEKINFSDEGFRSAENELKKLENVHDEYIGLSRTVEREKEVMNAIDDYSKKISDISEKISELESALNTIKFSQSEYGMINEQIHEKSRSVGELGARINDMNNKRREMELEYERLVNDLKKLLESEKKMKNYESFISWIDETFLPGINEIVLRRVNTLRLEFEKSMAEWFRILLPESDMDVGIDGNFNPVVRNGDYYMDYSALSGGESNALAFSYRLALNSLIKKFKLMDTNFILLDEPTDGFSEKQIMRMGDVFSKLNIDQILIVTHENGLENFADNRINIFKEDGVSRI